MKNLPTDHDGYTTEPTHLRVFGEFSMTPDGATHAEWFIDGADDDGNYTESYWSYDTFAEAIADLPDFVEKNATSGVTFVWRSARTMKEGA
jgi:hypothetical protein